MHNPEKLISGIRKGELKKKNDYKICFCFFLFYNERIKVDNDESWELKLGMQRIFKQYANNLNNIQAVC